MTDPRYSRRKSRLDDSPLLLLLPRVPRQFLCCAGFGILIYERISGIGRGLGGGDVFRGLRSVVRAGERTSATRTTDRTLDRRAIFRPGDSVEGSDSGANQDSGRSAVF